MPVDTSSITDEQRQQILQEAKAEEEKKANTPKKKLEKAKKVGVVAAKASGLCCVIA